MKGTQPRRPWPLKRASVAGAVLTYGLLLSYCAALYVLVLAIGGFLVSRRRRGTADERE